MTEYRRNLEAGLFDPKRKKAAKKDADAEKSEQSEKAPAEKKES